MNRKINHPIFSSTDEVKEFTRRAIDAQLDNQILCGCCNQYADKENIKSYEKGMYYVCANCWHEERPRVKNDLIAIYNDAEDVVPFVKIDKFFTGYFE